MKRLTIIPLTVLAFTPLTGATAQEEAPPLERGQRVRVTAPLLADRPLVGSVERFGGDSLGLSAEDATVFAVPLASITRLEVSRGKRSHTAVGAVLGFVAFAGLGFVIGSSVDCGSDCPPEQGGAIAAGVAAIPGALIGALVGSSIKADRWDEVPLDRLRLSVVARRDRQLAFGVSVSF